MTDPIRVVDAVPILSARAVDSHKGTYGRVLIAAGSRGMSGAATLCGAAALRSGAGLVTIACPNEIQAVVAAGNPCHMTIGLTQHADSTFSEVSERELLLAAETADILAIGPGLGRRPDVRRLVIGLLTDIDRPTVIDADAIHILPPLPEEWRERKSHLIFTPHPGEFAHLLGMTTAEVQRSRRELAIEFARHWRLILLLKGHESIVTDGTRVYTNTTGNPGMATGGSGDVLTGILAAFLAQGLSAFDAAVLASWVHGRAGDLAAEEFGEVSMIASDLLTYLPTAIKERSERRNVKSA